MFCFFSEITDNNYHYNLLIAVKSDFDLNLIYKNKFNLIEVVSINQIYERGISYDYMKILFNFDKLKDYSFYHYNEPNYNKFMKNLEFIFKNSKECLDFENFYKKIPKLSNLDEKLFKKYVYLLNESSGARSEILDQRIYYSYIFKSFGWHMFLLNYEFSDRIYCLTSDLKHHYKIKYTYDCNPTFFLKEYGLVICGDNLPDYYSKGYSPECL
jgi:hypothetical protein